MNDFPLGGYYVGLPDQTEQHCSQQNQGQRKGQREL
jgi:hypothetical protein